MALDKIDWSRPVRTKDGRRCEHLPKEIYDDRNRARVFSGGNPETYTNYLYDDFGRCNGDQGCPADLVQA